MSPVVEKALEAITARTNLCTGLTHPNDLNAAKEMFQLLRLAGEVLDARDIASWAWAHGWQLTDAKELGRLGQRIGSGRTPKVQNGPWWPGNIIERWKSESITPD
jgi:hypothetical protein